MFLDLIYQTCSQSLVFGVDYFPLDWVAIFSISGAEDIVNCLLFPQCEEKLLLTKSIIVIDYIIRIKLYFSFDCHSLVWINTFNYQHFHLLPFDTPNQAPLWVYFYNLFTNYNSIPKKVFIMCSVYVQIQLCMYTIR